MRRRVLLPKSLHQVDRHTAQIRIFATNRARVIVRATPVAWTALLVLLIGGPIPASAQASQSLEASVAPLLDASCVNCHGAGTRTPLDLSRLGYDLTDRATFKTWERLFTRVENGEMPPKEAPRPDPAVRATALGFLKAALVNANVTARGGQRTLLRRLTALEYGYAVADLLRLDESQSAELQTLLPPETVAGGRNCAQINDSGGAAARQVAAREHPRTARSRIEATISARARPPGWYVGGP